MTLWRRIYCYLTLHNQPRLYGPYGWVCLGCGKVKGEVER